MRKNKFCKVEENTNEMALQMFNQGKSITKIAKELNIDRGCLSTRLKKMGADIVQHCNRQHDINHDYFHDIDTEEKAYWLGFLYADGYVSKDSTNMELSLAEKDVSHLIKFNECLSSTYEIKNRVVELDGKFYNSCRLIFSSSVLKRDLCSHGCIPQKTFDLKMPNIDDNLMRHFIRGYFDGDGCISLQDTLNKTQMTFSSGCYSFLEELSTYLNRILDISLYVREARTCYEIRLFNNMVKIKILNYMYEDAHVYLDRKYNLYILCRLKPKTTRRLKIKRAELSGETVIDRNPSPKAS